jgi:hypothetical protein
LWHRSDLPRTLEALILRLLAKTPEDRPEDASTTLKALAAVSTSAAGPSEAASDTNPLDRLAGGIFVGREKELDELRGYLEETLAGHGRTAMLVGEPGILKDVCNMPEDRVLDLLEEADAARVIAEVPGTMGRYIFAHALIRETLSSELSATRRVRLHRQIAHTLEALHGQKPDPYLAQIAYHYFEGRRAATPTRRCNTRGWPETRRWPRWLTKRRRRTSTTPYRRFA